MLALSALLASLMGLTLGLFGGGGSILAVPILLYATGAGAREAIASSLLIVGITSLACVAQHARTGHVRWRMGATFGAFAMAGAYAGGRAAAVFEGTTLLLLFVAMMIAAGLAMLRGRRSERSPPEPRPPSLPKIAIDGLVVGAATGLVGAGGGFLVVPALVLFAGLGMREAVGTSTLIIAMKSFAGFSGHAAHVAVDYELIGWISAFAVAGSFAGAWGAQRLDPATLKRSFGVFVLVMASAIGLKEAPDDALAILLVERWPFWAGGLAIGAFVLVFLRATGKALGVSTGYYDACALPFDAEARRSWRIPFLVGIVGGGLLAALAAGGPVPTVAMGMFDTLVSASLGTKALVFTGGGLLLGFGARLAGGCTSGHGIVGVAQMARSSIAATAIFMVTGVAVTHLLLGAAAG